MIERDTAFSDYDRAVSLRLSHLGVFLLCALSGCGRLGLALLDLETNDGPLGEDTLRDSGSGVEEELCAGEDADRDGVCDAEDNCPDVANADQADHDANDLGDACENGASQACSDDLCACLDGPALSALTAHWPFDETSGEALGEATGHAPAGALVNFPATAWEAGHIEGALRFDGVDDYVSVGDAGSLKTLSFWLKPESRVVVAPAETPAAFPSSTGPRNEWSNPRNAFSAGGGNASAAILVGSKEQHWGGFHLTDALPEGAVLQGISVSIATGNFGLLGSFGVELSWDGGASHTDASYSWGQLVAGASDRTAGGPDKLWGRTWTRNELSDASFRVRAKFGGVVNTMTLDYLQVQIHYLDVPRPRGVLKLSDEVGVSFTSDGAGLSVSNWPGAQVYVDGQVGAQVGEGFSHVVVTSFEAVSASALEFGRTAAQGYPLHGVLDDVRAYEAALTGAEVDALWTEQSCDE